MNKADSHDTTRNSMRLAQDESESISLVDPNYGTMTDARNTNLPSSTTHHRGRLSAYTGMEPTTNVPIDVAMNRIKAYRLFFWIGILPMILSFAFSDLIVDSLNFLELIPVGLECQTTRMTHENGEDVPVWIPCSKNRICHAHRNDILVRENGEAVYRKSSTDYYTMQNWVESMDIE